MLLVIYLMSNLPPVKYVRYLMSYLKVFVWTCGNE